MSTVADELHVTGEKRLSSTFRDKGVCSCSSTCRDEALRGINTIFGTTLLTTTHSGIHSRRDGFWYILVAKFVVSLYSGQFESLSTSDRSSWGCKACDGGLLRSAVWGIQGCGRKEAHNWWGVDFSNGRAPSGDMHVESRPGMGRTPTVYECLSQVMVCLNVE